VKLKIRSRDKGFAATMVDLYKKDPEVTINFLNTFGEYMDTSAYYLQDYVKMYQKFKSINAPKDHVQTVVSALEKCVDNFLKNAKHSNGRIINDTEIQSLNKIFHLVPDSLKQKFSNLFIVSFSYAYKYRQSYTWEKHRKYSTGLTKTAYKSIMHDLLSKGHADIYEFVSRAAYALPLNGLREFVNEYTEKGFDDPKVLSILRDVPEFCHLTYTKEDMENVSKRRGLLRRATEPNSAVKNRLRFMVTFTCEDIRGINVNKRWNFLSKYYGYQGRYNNWAKVAFANPLSTKGYGPKIKLERDPTYDEMEQLLFPLIIAKYEELSEHCRNFLSLYKDFLKNKDVKKVKVS